MTNTEKERNPVRKTIEYVLKNSSEVKINREQILSAADALKKTEMNSWLSISPYNISQLNTNDKISYIFVLDAISFCYWGSPKWNISYKEKNYDGAQAMMACIGRAIEEKIPILNPEYLSNISRKDIKYILRGNTEIPLIEARRKIWQELGKNTKKIGDFKKIIELANHDAIKLIDIIIKTFPNFEDNSIYKGRKIYFNKRAQLLVSDISHILETDNSQYRIYNTEQLTGCADYKIPQVLRKLKILEYSKKLSEKIDNKKELDPKSEEVPEIRAKTIGSISALSRATNIPDNKINDCLWLLGQKEEYKDKPYPLIRTTDF